MSLHELSLFWKRSLKNHCYSFQNSFLPHPLQCWNSEEISRCRWGEGGAKQVQLNSHVTVCLARVKKLHKCKFVPRLLPMTVGITWISFYILYNFCSVEDERETNTRMATDLSEAPKSGETSQMQQIIQKPYLLIRPDVSKLSWATFRLTWLLFRPPKWTSAGQALWLVWITFRLK